MLNLVYLLLGLGLISGQLIKLPLTEKNGLIVLDLSVFFSIIILLLLSKFKFIKPPKALIFAAIFLLIGIISIFISPLSLDLNEQLISLSYALRFISYLFLGYLIFNLEDTQKNIKITKLFLYSGLIIAVIGLVQFLFLPNLMFLSNEGWDPHYFRTVSSLLDPNFAGSLFALTLLLIFTHLKNKKLVFSFIIVFIALLTTFSRGAYLMFLIIFLTYSTITKSLKNILLTLILALTLYLGFLSYTKFVAIPRNIDRTQSAQFRVSSWNMGWQVFQKSPIIGVGFNSYRFALSKFNIAPDQFIQSRGGSSNDSSLLHALATTGILGFIFYILFLTNLFLKSLNNKKDNIIIFCTLLGLVIQSFFANSLFYPHFLLWISLASVLVNPVKDS